MDKIKALVLDAGPLLLSTPLQNKAEKYYTIPAVLAEVRDKKSRTHLDNFGVDIILREPCPESIKAVTEFSKLTGDYAVLSSVDLQVLALTHMLEVEHNGTWRIRSRPGEKIQPSKPDEPKIQQGIDVQEKENVGEGDMNEKDTRESLKKDQEKEIFEPTKSTTIVPPLLNENNLDELSLIVDTNTTFPDPVKDITSDSSDGEWITPDNLSKRRAKDLGIDVPDETKTSTTKIKVALMTTDFAIQNTLIQMGLNLISIDGMRIRKLKTYVLRCHACFKTTRDMTKKFCPSCGNNTLLRASTTTHPDGTVQIHLKKNFQYKLRGTKYSIPNPKGGRLSNTPSGKPNLVLREDQKEYQRAVKFETNKKEKMEKQISTSVYSNVFDQDWVPSMLLGENGRNKNNEKQGINRVGYGRRNPNERKK